MPTKAQAKITPAVIDHVASVARLALTEAEKKKFLRDLNEILAAFRTLDEVRTENVAPAFQPLPLADVLRDDIVEKCITQERALLNTQHKEKGFFKGPKVTQ